MDCAVRRHAVTGKSRPLCMVREIYSPSRPARGDQAVMPIPQPNRSGVIMRATANSARNATFRAVSAAARTSAPDIARFRKDSGDVSGRADRRVSAVAGHVAVRVSPAA